MRVLNIENIMRRKVVLLLGLMLLTACISQEPSDIPLHAEECEYCKMVISDQRFTAQLVSEKGKSYPFDSIECMAAYAHQNEEVSDGAKFYVTNFTQPGQWLTVEEASIYQSVNIQSPMGLSLFAIDRQSAVPAMINNAEQQSWQQTVVYVTTKWKMSQ